MIENLAASFQFYGCENVKAQFMRLQEVQVPEEECQCVSPVDVDIIWHSFLTSVIDLS
jgi:hypothetical protein